MTVPGDEPIDERVIQSARAGEEEAFAALVRCYKSRVFSTAARFARDDHELDDLAQEVFIKVFRRLDQYRGDAPFEHWISRITVRTCYELLRRRRREGESVPIEKMELAGADPQEARHARELLDGALGRLAPEERLVIPLLEIEERSVREVAALTVWSEVKVKVRAFRARARLKEVLKGCPE